MLSRRQSPRCAPSSPRSASGTSGGLSRAGAPQWGDAEPFPSLCSQEPPPQPPGADHRLHQPRLFHLRGSAQRVGRSPRRSPQEAGRGPGRGPEVPEPRWTAGPVALRGGAVVWPAPLWATEPVPWAPPQPPESGPPQETQVCRPDEGRGGAGRLLAVRGHSPEPAGAAVTAEQGRQTGAPTVPDPPRRGAAPAAPPGSAEAAREAGSAGRFGPGCSAAPARRPAPCQDIATAVPSPVHPLALGSRSLLLSPAPSDGAPGARFPSAQLPKPPRWFPLLSLSGIKRQGLGACLHTWFCERARRKCVEPAAENTASWCPGCSKALPPASPPSMGMLRTPALEAALAHRKADGCHSPWLCSAGHR